VTPLFEQSANTVPVTVNMGEKVLVLPNFKQRDFLSTFGWGDKNSPLDLNDVQVALSKLELIEFGLQTLSLSLLRSFTFLTMFNTGSN